MQAEIVRQRFAHRDAAHAVAALVEEPVRTRRCRAVPAARRDAAADAALRRHADAINPLAGVVVHSARRHHAQNLVDKLGSDGALRRVTRIDAAIRERCADDREVAAVDSDRALPEVEFQRGLGVVVDDAEVAQHVADGAVAMAGRALRAKTASSNRERGPHTPRTASTDPADPRFRAWRRRRATTSRSRRR